MRARLSAPSSFSLAPCSLAGVVALLVSLSGCSHEVAPSGCVQDTDCFGVDEVCVQGSCAVLEQQGCQSDLDCNTNAGEACLDGICTPNGQPATGCTSTRECPINNYCNTATSQCQPLLEGWCREAAQCGGSQALCSATTTDVPGRCVECLRDSDCGAGGTCVNPGVCEAGTSNPGPGPGPGPGPTDPTDPGSSGDWCEDAGYYGDGMYCDEDCPQYDVDCDTIDPGDPTDPTDPGTDPGGGIDYCEILGYYGDGFCDFDCPSPDPDCGGESDPCALYGYYGDGECDDFCAQPDTLDCTGDPGGNPGGGETDECALRGWYGDGEFCDDCPQPDPDCETLGGALGENDACVQNGQILECGEGLDCIWAGDGSGNALYGACKRICDTNADCGGEVCANGFLANGQGICGTPLSEGQQGCSFWEQSGSFCFDPSTGQDEAFLECLSGTCRYVCDYAGNTEGSFDCGGNGTCSTTFQSYEGYNVDLAVCQ